MGEGTVRTELNLTHFNFWTLRAMQVPSHQQKNKTSVSLATVLHKMM